MTQDLFGSHRTQHLNLIFGMLPLQHQLAYEQFQYQVEKPMVPHQSIGILDLVDFGRMCGVQLLPTFRSNVPRHPVKTASGTQRELERLTRYPAFSMEGHNWNTASAQDHNSHTPYIPLFVHSFENTNGKAST